MPTRPCPKPVVAGGRPRPSSRTSSRSSLGRVLDGHVDLAAAGVLEGVGEPLLHDPVRREVERARQRDRLALHVQPYVEPGGAHVAGQRLEVVQPGLRRRARAGRRPARSAPSRRRISASAVRPACSTLRSASLLLGRRPASGAGPRRPGAPSRSRRAPRRRAARAPSGPAPRPPRPAPPTPGRARPAAHAPRRPRSARLRSRSAKPTSQPTAKSTGVKTRSPGPWVGSL